MDSKVLLEKQLNCAQEIVRAYRNFKKDGPKCHTEPYLVKRIRDMESLRDQFEANHDLLNHSDLSKEDEYFTTNYLKTMETIQTALDTYNQALETHQNIGSDYQLGAAAINPPVNSKSSLLGFSSGTSQSNPMPHDLVLQSKQSWLIQTNLIHRRCQIKHLISKGLLEQTYATIMTLQNNLSHEYQTLTTQGTFWEGLEEEFNQLQDIMENALIEISVKLQTLPEKNGKGLPKLPTLTLPKFSGLVKDYRPFIQLYEKIIHENKNLSSIEKMNYLVSSIQGDAKNAVKHLTITEENILIKECWL